ncbi:MAG: YHS domain-containing protein [Chloroflexota bacterium]
METDPVCGMSVNPGTAAAKSVYEGQTYHFCSPVCKSLFEREPEKYLGSEKPAAHEEHR